jgi:hypothetical protein
MGRFLKKCHTEYFLIYHFGKPLRCPTISHQWFTRTTNFGKLALKMGCERSFRSKNEKPEIIGPLEFPGKINY